MAVQGNSLDLNYHISGNPAGPWLVFLHGLLGSHANWRRITPPFEQKFKILTLDQRGHGRSPRPDTGYAPEDFAGDLLRLFDHLGISKAFLVGHSMGGRNAQCFAFHYPDRVEKLVIEDIGPVGNEAAGTGLIEQLKEVPVPFSSKKEAKEFLMTHFEDPKLGSFLYLSVKEVDGGKVTWSFNMDSIQEIIEKGRGKPRWNEVEGLRVKTLLIRGALSKELPQEEYEKILKCNTMIKGVVVEDAGHWIHFEKPDGFINIVNDFFEGRM